MISKCGSSPIFTLQENGKKDWTNTQYDNRNSVTYSDREAKKCGKEFTENVSQQQVQQQLQIYSSLCQA